MFKFLLPAFALCLAASYSRCPLLARSRLWKDVTALPWLFSAKTSSQQSCSLLSVAGVGKEWHWGSACAWVCLGQQWQHGADFSFQNLLSASGEYCVRSIREYLQEEETCPLSPLFPAEPGTHAATTLEWGRSRSGAPPSPRSAWDNGTSGCGKRTEPNSHTFPRSTFGCKFLL